MGRPDARDLCAAEAGAGAGLSGIVTSRTRRSRRCTVAQGGPRDLHRGAASQGLPRHATARARHPLAVWLKEMEEEEERKRGQPLDNSIEIQLDSCPEFFNSHDREFHVASLPYKPDFKVMSEGWDGTTRDPDEVLYEISMKEDQILYEEFVQRLEFNKKKVRTSFDLHHLLDYVYDEHVYDEQYDLLQFSVNVC
ncbi:hypothetical protein ZEAMMB73_Zm00001d012566 [Zea mays]|uniref:Uncharacterized protein n=1 Tax=Zea mays TaxID=4577 RepID=A0A1D6G9U6_MAIZE|nr:hypothetical protein ZEAMMB73_Zm00001d012566 [Zea mays]